MAPRSDLSARRWRRLVPDDAEMVGGLAADISYRNARRFFGFA
jgi:hypothetical protein